MRRAQLYLKVVLVVTGGGCLLALFPSVMPLSWMAVVHERVGLGPMPQGPAVEYMARTLSAFYAFLGGLLVLAATDVRRFAPVITYTAVGGVVFAVFLAIVDHTSGLPLWWTVGESVATLAAAVAALVLQRMVAAADESSATPSAREREAAS